MPSERLIYVVSYAFDAATGHGYVYLPGRSDKGYYLNVGTILRGRGKLVPFVDSVGRCCETPDRVSRPVKEPVSVEIRHLQCAGMNRHEAEGEETSRERSSDPLGPEFCASPIAR